MKRAAKLACMIAGAVAAALAFVLPARASDNSTLQLTPQQTLALYGASIPAQRYDYEDGNTSVSDIEFQYVGVTTDYVGSGAYGHNIPIIGNIIGTSSVNSTNFKSIVQRTPYIIYSYTAYSNSGWEYNSGLRFSIELSPHLRGITNYDGNFIFSIGDKNYNSPRFRSTALYSTSQGIKSVPVESGWGTAAIAQTYMQSVGQFGQIDDNYIISGVFTDVHDETACYFSGTQFDLDTITLSWYGAGGKANSAVIGYNTTMYLFISCPYLWNYNPPPETTVATTKYNYSILPPQSTKPAQTVDLSNLESGVAAIVEQGVEANNNLDWIGSNVMVGVNNLAYIANRLDDIYNAMQQAGKVPIDSTGELMNGVQSALTSYTTAKIPTDAAAGLTFWAWLMGKITAVAFIGELAAFGAVLAVTYFILFRGRNS